MQLSLLAKLHQIHNPLLGFGVSFNVPLGGAESAMAGQHLHITQ